MGDPKESVPKARVEAKRSVFGMLILFIEEQIEGLREGAFPHDPSPSLSLMVAHRSLCVHPSVPRLRTFGSKPATYGRVGRRDLRDGRGDARAPSRSASKLIFFNRFGGLAVRIDVSPPQRR